MKVLVIGGTGFIGQNVVRRLIGDGIEVAVFHRGKTNVDFQDAVKHIHGDRNQLDKYVTEFRRFGPEIVLDMIPYTRQQTTASVTIFKEFAKRIVALSSGDVYRNYDGLRKVGSSPPDEVPLSEKSPLREHFYPYRNSAKDKNDWLYKYEKILVERVLMSEPELPCTILRLPKVYGPNDFQHYLFPYLKRMDDGRATILLEDKQASWLWTRGFVENVSAAIVLATTDERTAGQVYNIGDGDTLSEKDWIMRIAEAANWKGKILLLPKEYLPSHLRTKFNWRYDIYMDVSRIQNELGYVAPIPLNEALRRTVNWTRSNPPTEVSAQGFNYHAEDAVIKEY